MSARVENFIFGHPVVEVVNEHDYCEWRWADTGEIVTRAGINARSCPQCGLRPTAKCHDPCIADLPGVDYACCGHGVEEGYVKLTNGQILRGTWDHIRDRQVEGEGPA